MKNNLQNFLASLPACQKRTKGSSSKRKGQGRLSENSEGATGNAGRWATQRPPLLPAGFLKHLRNIQTKNRVRPAKLDAGGG